ncbi:hypothetical protein GF371_00050 [Candidatus Woesearchaeota archaeon]|nr:hypothetical protein [Candidatus Woesearchaeota archaeon]
MGEATFDPETGEIIRQYVDLSTLTLDGQRLPFTFVKSDFLWKNEDPAFRAMIKELEKAPQPGFFLTNKEGNGTIRTRWALNRHGIWKSEKFRDSNGLLYRDVDAKGIGYTRGHPPVFLSVREPEMSGDMEMRGISDYDVAIGDRLHSEEIYGMGIRIARFVAQIELLELVNQEGEIVPRQEIGDKLGLNFDRVRPTLSLRAMGTTARVWDINFIDEKVKNRGYVREIIDDAIALVSEELGQELTPADYAAWFVDTMGKQLGLMHKNRVWTDFMAQIHGGMHNLTLDGRLCDTYHYQTPQSCKRRFEHLKAEVEKHKESQPHLSQLNEQMLEEQFGKTEEQVRKQNAKGEATDKWHHVRVAENFLIGVNEIHPTGILAKEAKQRLEKAYASER